MHRLILILRNEKKMKKNLKNQFPLNFNEQGFSLIEVMIGLVIGLIATLVITQTLSTFESKKRTTTGTADAQTNGSIAIYSLHREIQNAGYGFPLADAQLPDAVAPNVVAPNAASMATQAQYNAKVAADAIASAGRPNFSALRCNAAPTVDHDSNATTDEVPLIPIQITDGGTGSDTVSVTYGNTQFGGLPTSIDSITGQSIGLNPMGCRNGDVALIVRDINAVATNNCVVAKVTSTNAYLDNAGVSNMTIDKNIGTLTAGEVRRISCLGTIINTVFSVTATGNQLNRNGTPIISDVVSLQAQYGISPTQNSDQVTAWVNATGADWATPSIANRNRIKAIRIAIIARNPKPESTIVSTACSANDSANPTGVCAWAGDATSPAPDVDLSGTAANWNRYRYRAYDIVVPLRNMRYSGALL